ncbi:hypothetical protein LWI28_006512 [Acer negundo]|uniref:RING-type domain-containing protein n=1 Tax=Acer negundo TaxID=4023 RepID=A0AAD5IP90_ACENE|nr:hypothetical protein LWI28_006512 [Acer negundo]KAK4843847.1 hypothetical protein QYF36_013387 [Acer negundo]
MPSIKDLLSYFKFLLMMALTHLGLPIKPQEQADYSAEDDDDLTSHVLILDSPTPSIITIPAQEMASLIKKKLPVVEFINFLERFGDDDSTSNNSICNVCLDSIEKKQEIRELSSCCHVFHKQCLDSWVDVGQITCPLCRSMLLPLKGHRLQLQEVLA